MEVFLARLLAAFLDPIGWVIILVALLVWGRRSIIAYLTIATGEAIVSETLLTSMQYTREWGEGIVVQWVAAFITTALIGELLYRLRWKKRESQDGERVDSRYVYKGDSRPES